MTEVQTQWVKEDGKWCQKQLNTRPALPSRPTQSTKAPTLPPRSSRLSSEQTAPRPLIKSSPTIPRRPSEDSSIHSRRTSEVLLSRKNSNESITSTATAETSLSALSNGTSITSKSDRYSIRAPEYDPASLPALPPRKTKEEKEAEARAARYPIKSTKSTTSVPRITEPVRPSPPPRPQTRPPPPLPTRGNLPEQRQEVTDVIVPALPTRPREQPKAQIDCEQAPALPRRLIPPPAAKRSALSLGFNNTSADSSAQASSRSNTSDIPNGKPPPVPTASRPDLAALQASKPKVNGTTQSHTAPPASSCLYCRDFSAPDSHAARFPREALPSHDIGWLSRQLTAPFTSVTDKARAIFTWLHHNIDYDVVSFFNNNVKPSTPNSTLATGLAVCEGYAALFADLAIKSGLEAVVIGGGSKGYGHQQLKPGEPLPPFESNHAWNAFKMDDGQWKLVDPCWGAGHVTGAGQPYSRKFSPQHFCMSNDLFGLSHYPTDTSKQYRNDGRIMSWEEFFTGYKHGTGAEIFSGHTFEYGVSEASMRPMANPIVLSEQGPTVRFRFQTVCPHMDAVQNAKGGYPIYCLIMDGLKDTQRNYVPFKKGDGIWWCDVPIKDLGRPGQTAMISAVPTVEGRSGRGYPPDKYLEKLGRAPMEFGGVAQWTMA